eukprot:2475342-Rhodomonas_salina.1
MTRAQLARCASRQHATICGSDISHAAGCHGHEDAKPAASREEVGLSLDFGQEDQARDSAHSNSENQNVEK